MATSLSSSRRERCLLLPLPPDFLRLPHQQQHQPPITNNTALSLDEQLAYTLHHQLNHPRPMHGTAAAGSVVGGAMPPSNIRGRLLISVMQGKLTKNYGMTRMDPYVRIHVGHNIYETPTDVNGSKVPRWNKTIQCFLPNGIQQIYLEIYDECSFSVDELIAYAYIQIPEEIFKVETIEEWYNLSGKQGEGKEGQILLVFSFMATTAAAPVGPIAGGGAMMMTPYFNRLPGQQQPVPSGGHPQQQPQVPPQPAPTFNQEDYQQLCELFPQFDQDLLKTIYEDCRFNKDRTVEAVLVVGEENTAQTTTPQPPTSTPVPTTK